MKLYSPLSIAAIVAMPVSFLCYAGSAYLQIPEKTPLGSDEVSEGVIYNSHSSNRQRNLNSDNDSSSDIRFRNTHDEANLLDGADDYIVRNDKVALIYDDYTSGKYETAKTRRLESGPKTLKLPQDTGGETGFWNLSHSTLTTSTTSTSSTNSTSSGNSGSESDLNTNT